LISSSVGTSISTMREMEEPRFRRAGRNVTAYAANVLFAGDVAALPADAVRLRREPRMSVGTES
jgi:hypothetical protein